MQFFVNVQFIVIFFFIILVFGDIFYQHDQQYVIILASGLGCYEKIIDDATLQLVKYSLSYCFLKKADIPCILILARLFLFLCITVICVYFVTRPTFGNILLLSCSSAHILSGRKHSKRDFPKIYSNNLKTRPQNLMTYSFLLFNIT